jgi:hypothetical protein
MAAGGLALCALNLGWLQVLQQQDDRLQARLTTRALEISGLASVPRGQEVFAVQQALASAEADPTVQMFAPSLTLPLATILQRAHQQSVEIQELDLQPERFVVRGKSVAIERATAFRDSLTADGFTVALDTENEADRAGFTLTGSLP